MGAVAGACDAEVGGEVEAPAVVDEAGQVVVAQETYRIVGWADEGHW